MCENEVMSYDEDACIERWRWEEGDIELVEGQHTEENRRGLWRWWRWEEGDIELVEGPHTEEKRWGLWRWWRFSMEGPV